jgi:alpha-mannosidase/mannosylglycerate hydrolase
MKPTYHIVSHSHWDREWYFPFDRFRAMLVDMVEDLIELFERNREFKSYTLDGQMAAVMDYLEVRPDRTERIRELVEKKKLFIGPWYILSDEFLASGESQIRNLLLGFRLGKTLGGVMKIGYIPDQFSHIAQMPQILRGFGIDTAMFYRGFGGEPGQEPSEYWWVAPDGSRVLLYHLPKDGYSAGYFGTDDEQVIVQKFDRLKKELDERATTSQRLFFNGGDHHWPDENVTMAVRVLNKNYFARVLHSNFPDFISALKKEVGKGKSLSRLEGETRFGYRHAFSVLGGVFSSRIYLKQMNAACQILLERILEPLNILGIAEGMRSRTPQIGQAWKYVIQNQDHDALCGTSTDEVHREMVVRYEKAKQIGAHVSMECLAHLLPYDEREMKDDRYLILYNPSPIERSGIVEADVEFYLQDVVVGLNPEVKIAAKLPPVAAFRLTDPDGNKIPYQILSKNEGFGITYSRHDYPHQTLVDRFTILVSAEQIPSLGWKALSISRETSVPPVPQSLAAGDSFIENDLLRVSGRPDGSVMILDKRTGSEFGPMNLFEDSGDVGDEYNYSYPLKDEWYTSDQFRPVVRVIEKGPLRAALQVDHLIRIPASASSDEKSRSSEKTDLRISTVLYLTPNSRRVDVKTAVDNTAKDHRLRVLFRSGIETLRSHADTPFAVVEREHIEYDVSKFPYEHPALVAAMQRFVTIHDKEKGMTLIAKGLPEYELKVRDKGVLALTLLRCVGKLSGRDLITRPGGAAGWWTETPEAQCLGTHVFEYSIYPHGTPDNETWSSILGEVESFTVPLMTVKRKNEQPVLSQSFLSLEPQGLQLSALKESEDGKGIIVRLCNPFDRTIKGRLRFDQPILKGSVCQLNEAVVRTLPVSKGNTVAVTLKPFEITTLKFIMKKKQNISKKRI